MLNTEKHLGKVSVTHSEFIAEIKLFSIIVFSNYPNTFLQNPNTCHDVFFSLKQPNFECNTGKRLDAMKKLSYVLIWNSWTIYRQRKEFSILGKNCFILFFKSQELKYIYLAFYAQSSPWNKTLSELKNFLERQFEK